MVGLAIIWTVFQSLNPVFLSSNNLVNLLFDCSTVGRDLARHRVHPDGRRDRSLGRLRQRLRLGARGRAVGQCRTGRSRWPILAALAAGAIMGILYALLFNRLGMPSFVSTLAGLLAVLGLQLYILGASRLDQPALRLVGRELRPDAGHAARRRLRARALAGLAYLPDRLSHGRAPPRRRPDAAVDRPGSWRARSSSRSRSRWSSFYLNRIAASPGCSACSSALVVAMNYALRRTNGAAR